MKHPTEWDSTLSNTSEASQYQQDQLQSAADEKFAADSHALHVRTDRMFVYLLMAQWAVAGAAAVAFSPFTWEGEQQHVHPHVALALLGGGLLVSLPALLAYLMPGSAYTRQSVTIAQVLFSSLLIHMTGGRIETHFHVFGSLAFIAAYRDWRLFPTATLIVVADHVGRGVWWPESIYGISVAPWWLWLEHGAWVTFEVTILLFTIRQSIKDMRAHALQAAKLDVALRQAEKSERQFRAGFEQSALGMAIETLDGAYLRINDRYCEITGYTRDELSTKHYQEITHPDDAPLHAAAMQRLFAGEQTFFQIEKRYLHKQGHPVWVRLTLSLVRDEQGQPDHLIAAVQDVTRERATQQEVAKLSLVASKTRHSVIISGPDGRIEWVNDGFTTLTGYSAQEAIGQNPGALLQGPATDDSAKQLIGEMLRARQAVSVELLNYHKDGHAYWINLEIDPVFDDRGELVHFVATQTDITDRRAREKQLQDATHAARAANTAKSQFLANMSHEIRTPLNGILGFADILARDEDCSAEDRRDYVATIRRSGRHLLTLINDILDLSKIEAGQMQFEKVECSPHQVLAEVASVLRAQAREKGLLLDYRWETAIPSGVVTDPARVKQLLMNLVGNAVKFTEQGRVDIKASFEIVEGRGELQFRVVDTGIGIPAEKLETIFKPFSQADETVTRRFGGTGLGLTISRNIAEQLGGRLTVESEVWKGTTFTVCVDAGDASAVTLLDAPPEDAAGDVAHCDTSGHRLDGVRVLIVDDGETNRKLLSLILKRAGAQITQAGNGLEAVQSTQAQSFDVILMDMQMPVLDGYSATTEIRRQGFEGPIIALTAHAMRGDRERCEQAGCSGYLSKPVDGARLLATVTDALGDPLESRHLQHHALSQRLPTYRSQLPTDDPEIRAIVGEFVEKLGDKLTAMAHACDNGDYEELATLAHWLKGAGGTVGFACLTEPAADLECSAKSADETEARRCLGRVQEIQSRLEV